MAVTEKRRGWQGRTTSRAAPHAQRLPCATLLGSLMPPDDARCSFRQLEAVVRAFRGVVGRCQQVADCTRRRLSAPKSVNNCTLQ
eukprot:6879756-Alexandrium_andersonii.AAC.1